MRITTCAVALLLGACTQSVGGLDEPTKGGTSREGVANDAGAASTKAPSDRTDAVAREGTPCETVLGWTSNGATACDACVSEACEGEVSDLRAASTTCSSSYEQAGTCATCACADAVLAKRAVCKAPWDAFFACKAARCAEACR